MNQLVVNSLGFILCALVIIYSGTKLAIYGDAIAEKTGMGKAWFGLVLMASVTSLPELITGISAVVIVDVPDLAVGDILGSCVFNLLILSILDAKINKPLFSSLKSSHIVASIFGIILMSIAGIAMYLVNEIPNIYWISSFTFLLVALYFVAVYGIFQYEQSQEVKEVRGQEEQAYADKKELQRAIRLYLLNAIIVIIAAVFLPYFGGFLAEYSGLGSSFFGTVFIAAATSLPELVVSLSALQRGSLDMAVGNLLGSNVYNMFILGFDDILYRKGPIYAAISSNHILSVFVAIIMTSVVVLGLLFKPKKKQFWILSLDALILSLLFVALMVYLFIKK
jgi:cation:H+ antiporter